MPVLVSFFITRLPDVHSTFDLDVSQLTVVALLSITAAN
jgi:hypothetical protein